MRHVGLEPTTDSQFSLGKVGKSKGAAQLTAQLSGVSGDLQELISRWDSLPRALRHAVMILVRSGG